MPRPGWTRNVDFAALHETFLVAGVATVLVIRTQLWLTNYPQLGGRGLHIAHLLWGGLLMVLAIGLLLTFVGGAIRRTAAVVGGIGFGFFIDELGKFITEDNDYFFRPAAALIYVIFVALFLCAQWLRNRGRLARSEYLANAVDLLAEAARRPLDASEQARTRQLLDRADPDDPLVQEVRAIVARLPPGAAVVPGPGARLSAAAQRVATAVVERPAWPRVLTVAFVAWAVLSLLSVWELVLAVGLDLGHPRRGYASDRLADLETVNVVSLASSGVSLVLVVAGVLRLRRGDRLGAYRRFEHALLVAIFVTRVFSFVESQFHAVFGLGADLVLLVALRGVTGREREREGEGVEAVEAAR